MDWINIALPKGRLGEKAYGMLKNSGYPCPAIEDPGRKLIFENPEKMVRYFWVKPSDVAIYVERCAADLAIVGKDMQQLNDYLMQKYDDGPGLEYGRPVIFDNGEVIEGMRYAKRP